MPMTYPCYRLMRDEARSAFGPLNRETAKLCHPSPDLYQFDFFKNIFLCSLTQLDYGLLSSLSTYPPSPLGKSRAKCSSQHEVPSPRSQQHCLQATLVWHCPCPSCLSLLIISEGIDELFLTRASKKKKQV